MTANAIPIVMGVDRGELAPPLESAMNYLRTVVLLAGLTALFMGVGYLMGGQGGMVIALLVATAMNLFTYWNSDRMVLSMTGAQEVDARSAPEFVGLVRELAGRAGLPMPRVYIMQEAQPNAFATGRNPKNSAVAVTAGIMKRLSEDELRGVIAHELAHIRNRDVLLQSVASAIGASITYLGYMLLWFGGDEDSGPLGLVASLAMVILAPLAATLIQLSISRQREYSADATGAEICGNPESLASALLRLEEGAKAIPMQVNQAAEPLYIVKPFRGSGIAAMFSTHPPIEERVRRLRQMRPAIG
jgi:heat shock protein HtpX